MTGCSTGGGGLGSITIRVKGTRPVLDGLLATGDDPKTWTSANPMFTPTAAVMVNLTQVIDLVANEATKGLLASLGNWPTVTAVPSLKVRVPAKTFSQRLGRSQKDDSSYLHRAAPAQLDPGTGKLTLSLPHSFV